MTLTLRKKHHRHGIVVVAAEGGVSFDTSPRLRDHIDSALHEVGEAPHLVVDFTKVDFCDSAGLGALVSAYKRVQQRSGTFGLVCPPGPVLRLLQMSGLHTILPVHARLDDALPDRDDAQP